MSALLDRFAQAFDNLPERDAAGLGDARRAALDAALREGLPHARSEAWKYTPLRSLERRVFEAPSAAAASIDPNAVSAIPTPRLVFVNGRFDDDASDLTGLPETVSLQPLSQLLREGDARAVGFLARRFDKPGDVFARLNAALADEGVIVRAEAGATSAKPLHLVFVGTADDADRAWHLRNFIELREGARLAIVEHHFAADAHAHLCNALTHVHLAQGAGLVHARVQRDSERGTGFLRTDATLARDAEYRRLDLELGAGLSRHELNVRLEGDNARITANGVLLASGRRHLDTRLGIEHIARDTACELTWRGLGTGRGRVVFHGGILIREGADGSDAMLSNKNLLLSEGAEIDTQPVLEIHADEVKAAHGATVGRLDANALFYLRSRGLPATQAQQLLTAAFCREPLGAVEDAGVREVLSSHLDQALAASGAA